MCLAQEEAGALLSPSQTVYLSFPHGIQETGAETADTGTDSTTGKQAQVQDPGISCGHHAMILSALTYLSGLQRSPVPKGYPGVGFSNCHLCFGLAYYF